MPLPPSISFCETELTPTSYEELARQFYAPAPQPAAIADFTNTHILTLPSQPDSSILKYQKW
jgi:hypothetical protein